MTTASHATFRTFSGPDNLAHEVAKWLLEIAIVSGDTFAVALSGGSTPRRLYECLSRAPYRDEFPWARTHWFWGDERFVPHHDPHSNYGMARETLFSGVTVAAANIHPIPTDESDGAESSAQAYERELKWFYGKDRLEKGRPLFDVTLLGLGSDGHSASLFPGSPVLSERERWVLPVAGPKDDVRITLTYPVLESSRYTAFLVTGAEKSAVLHRVRQGHADLPAARLRPNGALYFFCDEAAAGDKVE